jgi:hypothetical protein
VVDEWKTYDEFAYGIDTNRLPAADLSGETAGVTLGEHRFQFGFDDRARVSWTWDGESGNDPYDAVEVGTHALFLDIPFETRGRESLTVILSRRTGRAMGVWSHIAAEATPGVPQVGQEFWTGSVDGVELTGPEPAPTRDLIGRRALYRYSPNHLYEHVYLSSERYCWQNLEGVQRGHGDVDLATTYRFDDGLYVFTFREFKIPVASVWLYDMVELTSTGKFLGLTGDGTAENNRGGARIIPLGAVAYPDAQPV